MHAEGDCAVWVRAERSPRAYAYLLAVYLGNGSISRVRTTDRLRITLDIRYPRMIREVALAARRVVGRRHAIQRTDEFVGPKS